MISKDNKTPSKIQIRKAELAILSDQAKAIRQEKIDTAPNAERMTFWASRTVNYMLLNFVYNDVEGITYNTFNEWKKQGATVRKGSKATVIWGQPLKGSKTQEGTPTQSTTKTPKENQADDLAQYEFFPLCFLFSENEVYFPDTTEQPEPHEKHTETAHNEVIFDSSIMNGL